MKIEKDENEEQKDEKEKLNVNQVRNMLVKEMQSYYLIAQNQFNILDNLNLDLHEIQMAKIMTETILVDLRSKG